MLNIFERVSNWNRVGWSLIVVLELVLETVRGHFPVVERLYQPLDVKWLACHAKHLDYLAQIFILGDNKLKLGDKGSKIEDKGLKKL